MRFLRRLLQTRHTCVCGHPRSAHWIPFAAGHPCAECDCEEYR
jgi:hypothetical protein